MQEELAASSDTGLGLRAPSRIGAILGDRRLVLVILLLAGIAIQFWVGSRVPALNEKALMGGDTQLAALGFDTVFAVSEDDSMFVSVIYETVNWLKTNKRGMTFGVIFAATIMLLLTLIKKKSFRNPFANSLLGIVIGAPLGVCVNCAAPIAKGLYAGGARIETTLAAMISSPTLNVIVLTMLLSLFPLYLVILKLGFTIFFIVVFIPILVRTLAKNVEMNPADAAACPIDFGAYSTNEGNKSWGEALIWVAKNWLLSFWNVVKTTVPLMFLAGFLGALLVTVLPWESMAEIIPRGGLLFTLGGMLLLSLVGIFLPVPIAFDVIITAILLAAGMPVRYAMVLLFTLGIYSVYSFFVIWREISRPMAVALWVVLVFFGLAAGIAADRYDKWNTKIQRQVIFETLSESANPHGPRIFSVGQKNENEIYTEFRASRGLERVAVSGNFPRDIAIAKANFFYPVGSDEVMFTRLVGTEVGITDPYSYSASKALLSMGRFRGVSSGDVHNDGWPDLLLTSFDGLSLYANRGDGQFVEQKIGPLPDALAGTQVVNSILVDLDGDGWLDVVFATYRKGNFVIYNRNGQFDSDAIQAMPNLPGAIITAAMGFGDIDRDGDLDVVFGNYGLGSVGGLTLNGVARILTVSHDALLLNDHGQFSVTRISPIPGDTLSTLLSDINSDGILDLMIGIDFDPADQFYFGDGAGAFTPITRQDEIIPYTGSTTMNIVTADINNDLTPELFVAQITGRTGSSSLDLLEVEPAVCNELEGTEYQAPCERFMRIQADMMVMRKTRNMGICQTTDAEFRKIA